MAYEPSRVADLGSPRAMSPEEHAHWSEVLRETIEAATHAGVTLRQVAEDTGVGYNTLVKVRKEVMGTKGSRMSLKLHAIEQKTGYKYPKIIEALRAKGVGQKRAAEFMGISSNYLGHICDAAGIERLGRGKHIKRKTKAAPKREHCKKQVTMGGETHTLDVWAEKLDVNYHKLVWRIKHWPEENVLSGVRPARRKARG